ncbi:molybdopterin molybdenumtransferase MoeA [Betaproteobacteria bacterium]|nr:molybdopterin molybdenumtransferase MoeA [Betaproteobacteria bacterium]GHU02552.1 molybdopterin molybdenumtransferase MoeA [Betaproteobacteria bacterium]GHU20016.1 molybdopterin molybdenumtransferase MoeA [Betaproteobacteria bacterium]
MLNNKTTQPPQQSSDLTVRDAQASVLGRITPVGSEEIPLQQALGRVLAEDIRANRDLPPYDISAMDGYAVRSADIVDAAAAPKVLTVIEDIRAGDMPRLVLQPGQCARIMTGAPVPAGADTVVRVEDTQARPGDQVAVLVPTPAATDIRVRGENMRQGDVVLAAGTEIQPGSVGVLATVKRATVKVYRKPRVAILSSGDELEALSDPFNPDKIPDANSYTLMAQVQALGITPACLGIARDDPDELAGYLRQGLEYDVLLVSGGTSVGVHDHVRPTLEKLGVSMHFWRVRMRPGHPVAFGSAGCAFVFCLPGNPVSSMVCFEQFVLPALRRLCGHQRLFRRMIPARLTRPVKSKPGRAEFVRATLACDLDSGYTATPAGAQSSGDLLAMARADGLLVVPAASKGLSAGETVPVQLLGASAYQDEPGLGEEV